MTHGDATVTDVRSTKASVVAAEAGSPRLSAAPVCGSVSRGAEERRAQFSSRTRVVLDYGWAGPTPIATASCLDSSPTSARRRSRIDADAHEPPRREDEPRGRK